MKDPAAVRDQDAQNRLWADNPIISENNEIINPGVSRLDIGYRQNALEIAGYTIILNGRKVRFPGDGVAILSPLCRGIFAKRVEIASPEFDVAGAT